MRLLSCLALVAAASGVWATPPIFKAYEQAFKIAPSSKLDKLGCGNCHTRIPRHNDFGLDVKDAVRKAGMNHLQEALIRLGDADSDHDGFSNRAEIAAQTEPGNPASKPKGAPRTRPVEEAASSEPLIPKHTFHPTLVHFPIALYLFGAALDVWGARRQSSELRRAGYWNLLAGALASLIAVPTGLIAMLRLGWPLADAVLVHFAIALGATGLMLTTVVWRRRAELLGNGYWLLLLASSITLGVAGHFGGQLIYGAR